MGKGVEGLDCLGVVLLKVSATKTNCFCNWVSRGINSLQLPLQPSADRNQCTTSFSATHKIAASGGLDHRAGTQAGFMPCCDLPSDPDLCPGTSLTPAWFAEARVSSFSK